MIELQEHHQGTILPVRAHAGARRNAIGGERDGCLQVSVTQAPEKGKANKAIIALVASWLDVRKSQIEIVSGETSAIKRFLVADIKPAELAQRLNRLLAEL